MNKKNKVLVSVLVASVVALLIALCFVGNTFARYTLKQSESVTASIAEWGVTLTEGSDFTTENDDGTTTEHTLSVEGLKPSADKYDETGATQRVNSDNFVLVATLTNTGAVAADVTITNSYDASDAEYKTFTGTGALDDLLARGSMYNVTAANAVVTYETDETTVASCVYTPGTADTPAGDKYYGGSDDNTTGYAYSQEIGEHIKADLYYSTSAEEEAGSETLKSFEDEDDATVTLYPSSTAEEGQLTTIYIYLDVEWISDLENSAYDASDETSTELEFLNGDGFDTWCGMWVEGFTFGLTIEAVQSAGATDNGGSTEEPVEP